VPEGQKPSKVHKVRSGFDAGVGDLVDRLEDVLRLWIRWNDGYENSVETMFREGGDPQRLSDRMDQMDQLRRQALNLSRELLCRERSTR
jgi:hypothetical protein